jgi:O-antigen/teichoic acid export membrane protein
MKLSLINNKKITAVTLDQAILSATNFAINIMLIRHLSLENFGIYVIIFSFLMLANSVQTALITAPIGVIVSKLDDNEAVQYIKKLNPGQMALSIVIVLFFLILSSGSIILRDYEEYQLPLFGATIATFFYLGQLYLRSIMLSRLRVVDVLKNDLLYSIMQIIFLFILITTDYISVEAAFFSIGISAAIAIIYGLFQCQEFIGMAKVKILVGANENIKHGQWLLGTNLIAWVRINAINFIALYFVGAIAPAVIRAAQTIFGPVNVILVGLDSIVPQYCSKILSSSGINESLRILNKIILTFFFGMVVYSLFVSVFSYTILDILFGQEYTGYEAVVWIISIQYLFIVLQTKNLIALRVFDKTIYIFRSYVIELCITLIPGILLIRMNGLNGVAEWLLLSTISVFFITFYFHKLNINFQLSKGVRT